MGGGGGVVFCFLHTRTRRNTPQDKLVNYHMFQSDIPADNMSIDMFAMSQRKRQMLQHLDMTGKLFLDS